MSHPLTEADTRRIYEDALTRAMRHAAAHVSRDEALEIGHHVGVAVVRRRAAERAGGTDGRLDGDQALDAFIHRAVINRLRDLWRARRRRSAVEEQYGQERAAVAPGWTRPDADLESRELHRVIEGAVAALPPVRREVFLLVRRDQCSYREVADRLGIGVGTVHTHLSRANAALRQAVADYRHGEHSGTAQRPRTHGTRP